MNNNFYVVSDQMINFCKMISYDFFKDIQNILNIKYNLELYFRTDYFGNYLYGEFFYPNKIYLYLPRIITDAMYIASKYNFDRKETTNLIKTSFLEVLIHEMCHFYQKINMNKYNNDLEYSQEIEEINEIYSIMIMINNKDYFENKYGFKYNFSLFNLKGYNLYLSNQENNYCNTIKQNMENNYYYPMNDYKSIYLYNLISIIPDINGDELSQYMDNYNDIKILFRNKERNILESLVIKDKGQYLDPQYFIIAESKYVQNQFLNFYLSYDISVNNNILVIDITRRESIVNIWDE